MPASAQSMLESGAFSTELGAEHWDGKRAIRFGFFRSLLRCAAGTGRAPGPEQWSALQARIEQYERKLQQLIENEQLRRSAKTFGNSPSG